jgi:hypothetical protein
MRSQYDGVPEMEVEDKAAVVVVVGGEMSGSSARAGQVAASLQEEGSRQGWMMHGQRQTATRCTEVVTWAATPPAVVCSLLHFHSERVVSVRSSR